MELGLEPEISEHSSRLPFPCAPSMFILQRLGKGRDRGEVHDIQFHVHNLQMCEPLLRNYLAKGAPGMTPIRLYSAGSGTGV